MQPNYFFIDGSALTAQIRQLQRAEPTFRKRKLCPRRFLTHFMESLPDLHDMSYKRAIFYFPNGDEAAIEEFIQLPDHQKPGEVRDLHFKFCGHKLKKSAEFAKFVEESVPQRFQGRFSKSEKGIDIEMCCDAFRLVSSSKIDRLFVLTNDSDFVPFFKTIKDFGANISVLHLSTSTPPNSELLREADSYDVVPIDALREIFLPPTRDDEQGLVESEALASESEQTTAAVGEPESEKPEAEPSDLKIVDGVDGSQKED